MNVLNIAGRIGKDAETRYTADGQSVTGFSVAVDEYAGKGERRTLWVDCSMWAERGEKLAPYLLKGTPVAVTGQVGAREYNGKAYLTLNVRDVTLLGGKQDRQDAPRQPRAGGTGPVEHASDDFGSDEIPFATNRGIY